MLTYRAETILKSIVGQYIAKATPVPSQSIVHNHELMVSTATVRNEMAHLEQEGYITRPHPSSGSIPSNKGYRYYVESLGDVHLPLAEQRLISHIFHQVEKELNEWIYLAATLTAQMAHNLAMVTMPRPAACQFKRLEVVSLQDFMALVILVVSGAKIKEQLITFDQIISQAELTAIANRLSTAYLGLTSSQITATKDSELSPTEHELTNCLVKLMEAKDNHGHEGRYLDGLHFMLNQPEFTHSYRMRSLMELVEQRNLMKSIIPPEVTRDKVQVIIGEENKSESIQDYSVVISHYGLPKEAVGTIVVIGPTRMPYAKTIATISYLSSVLSGLEAKLYGKEMPTEPELHTTN